jgi:hypothetical protein
MTYINEVDYVWVGQEKLVDHVNEVDYVWIRLENLVDHKLHRLFYLLA